MDDFGFKLIDMAGEGRGVLKSTGEALVVSLPKIIRVLTVLGTIAMLLVAGGIFSHNIRTIHEYLHILPSLLADLLIGLVVGATAVGIHKIYLKIRGN